MKMRPAAMYTVGTCWSLAVGCNSGHGTDAGIDVRAPDVVDAAGDLVEASTGPVVQSVLEFHNHATRDGVFVDPTMTRAAVAALRMDTAFAPMVQGQVFSQPLLLADGPLHRPTLYVTTEENQVTAVDALTGAMRWQVTLAPPVPNAMFAPCGSITPDLGITGTGVIDPASRALLFDAMTLTAGAPKHIVYAVSVDTGTVQWQLDVSSTIAGFNSAIENQRGALTIVDGTLYVPYGGLSNGCGPFHGWVVAIPIASPTTATGWHTAARGGGIWSPGGVAADGTYVYAATSEAVGSGTDWAMANSQAVVRLGAGAVFGGTNADYFAPTNWLTLDHSFTQLGASGVVLLDLPGAAPSHLAFAIGKTRNGYLLDRDHMGGISQPLAMLSSATTGDVVGGMAAYTTALGSYVAFTGNPSGACVGDLTVLRIAGGATPSVTPGWCGLQHGNATPIVTRTDASGTDTLVWGLGAGPQGNGVLTAFDGDTGSVVVASDVIPGNLQHWISPIVSGGRIYVAGDGQVYAFTVVQP